jgi:hypothetical protein
VVRARQATEKRSLDFLPLGTARLPKQPHSCEPQPPCFEHLRFSWALERQLAIRSDEVCCDYEARFFQVIPELAAHVEVVSPGNERLPLVGTKKGTRSTGERLMAKEVVTLR